MKRKFLCRHLFLFVLAAMFSMTSGAYAKELVKNIPVWEMDADATQKRNGRLPDYRKLHDLVKSKKGITWVITGDSITHGALHTKAMRSYPEHWAEMIRWECRRFDDVVVNTGISGDTIVGIINKFEDRVKRFSPDIVSINIGMNDIRSGEKGLAGYRKGLTDAVKKIRALKSIPVLQVPSLTNNDEGDSGKILSKYAQAVREVADKEKVLLVDHEAHWKKFANTAEKRKSWMNDGVHPNGLGHQEMYKKMAYDLGLLEKGRFTSGMGDETL